MNLLAYTGEKLLHGPAGAHDVAPLWRELPNLLLVAGKKIVDPIARLLQRHAEHIASIRQRDTLL